MTADLFRHAECVMGTVFSFAVRGDGAGVDAAVRRLHDLDARLSPYRADSEISRLERGELLPSQASADVRFVLDRCAELRDATGGHFDVRATGRLDPSAYVKGWAAERAAELLTADAYCVGAGGDVLARGGGWRIGIQHPLDRDALAGIVLAEDLAVATSGTYERGAHIVGRGTGDVLSVTVTGPDLGLADAYSTAAFAMGADGPAWMLGLDGYESLTILADETVLRTPGFPLLEAA